MIDKSCSNCVYDLWKFKKMPHNKYQQYICTLNNEIIKNQSSVKTVITERVLDS